MAYPKEELAASYPLVVIVGPTASGKSELALRLAEHFQGEIIAADSRTIYEGMDIGTAKPAQADRERIPHHLLDITTPDKPITVADFKQRALESIKAIGARKKLSILVGGSGLYIDAIIYDFSFRSPADHGLRHELEALSVQALQKKILEQGLALPQNAQNPRHLIRTLETAGRQHSRTRLRPRTLILGIQVDRSTLRQRIERRVEDMVKNGFVEEVRRLARAYGWDLSALQAPGYRAFRPYIEGRISLDEAKAKFIQADMRYAKRQQTWFKRNDSIHWLSAENSFAQSVELITTLLNK